MTKPLEEIALAEDDADWTTTVPVEQIPAALGELEVLRARLLARLVAPGSRQASRTKSEAGEELLIMKEAARILGVPEPYIRELWRKGELPVVRVGPKYVRVRRSVLDAWIVQREDRHLGQVR